MRVKLINNIFANRAQTFLFAIILLFSVSLNAATVYYVKPIASGAADGSSWNDAMANIQTAITNASSGDEVWIAAGTYYVPDADGFNPKEGVNVYGGFAGTENALGDRVKSDTDGDGTISAWEFTNETILSGDINGDDDYSDWPATIARDMTDNADHIYYQSGFFNTSVTIWGGLIIEGGNANGAEPHDRGAGCYSKKNFQLQNSYIRYNTAATKGGATYTDKGIINNCRAAYNSADQGAGFYLTSTSTGTYLQIDNNSATSSGGGLYLYSADANASYCNSFNNKVIDGLGGGVYILSATLSYSEVHSNTTNNQGGGIYNNIGSIENCDIHDNTNTDDGLGIGGGIYSNIGTIEGSLIYRNKSAASAGGVYIKESSIKNCKIYDNETSNASNNADGGGLHIADGATSTNLVIFNNKADDLGGGVYSRKAHMINCTVVNNFAGNEGGGIYNWEVESTILNSVAWGNKKDVNTSNEIYNKSAGPITYSATQGTAMTGTGETNNIGLNSGNAVDGTSPYFVLPTTFVGLSTNPTQVTELENANWDIASSSALIDAGTDVGAPATDIDGGTRSTTDIGAYEYGAEAATPICLKDFNATVEHGSILLTWVTASETENAAFNLYRNNELIATLDGQGTSTEEHVYGYSDNEIVAGIYNYVLADVNYAGEENLNFDKALSVTINETNLLPQSYTLGNAYPNPFNPSTTLSYSLKTAADVDLYIFDLTGKIIKSWTYAQQSAGWYSVKWNATNNNGLNLSSGIYFYSIKANDFVQTKKMLLMK